MILRYTISRDVVGQFVADLVQRGEAVLYTEAVPQNRRLMTVVTRAPSSSGSVS